MDKRNRPATRRYRSLGSKSKAITISIDETLYSKLEKKLKSEPDNNMSALIETLSDGFDFSDTNMKKSVIAKTARLKKCFTFSNDFIKKLTDTGNRSATIEKILTEKL